MVLREELIRDINSIENPQLLHKVFEYLKTIKNANIGVVKNKLKVLKFAGILTQKQANKITLAVNDTFNKIEGEW